MKKVFIALFCLASTLSVAAQKQITLEDCFEQYTFYPQSSSTFFYMNDGRHYAHIDKKGLHIRDILHDKKDSLVVLELPDAAKTFDQFEFSDDETKLLLRTGTESVYRHSVLASYFVYNFKTQETIAVHEAAKQQFAALSPDGNAVAFVVDNNLYIKYLAQNKTVQVTRDGAKNNIINGLPDWVYEEEFSPVDADGMVATRWSPDGSRLAYIRFDETEVPEFPLTFYEGGSYPRRTSFKYPKVGAPNSKVSVHLYDTEKNAPVGEVMGLDATDYVPRIQFTPANQLVVVRLNRRQDTLDLLLTLPERLLYDQEEDKNYVPTRLLLQETDAAYVDVASDKKFIFLKNDPDHFLWWNETSGFAHVWRMPMGGSKAGLPQYLTSGNFDVMTLYGINESTGKFYFQAATPTPLDRQLWEGNLTGGAPRLLTPPAGTHEAHFSPTFEYMQHTWSDANTPPVVAICNNQDDTLRIITKNEHVRQLREEYQFVPKTFIKIPLADGTQLNASMILPVGFDANRQYPVLFDNYGGPGSQTVVNQYDGYMGTWHQMLAQKGYIVVSVDNRGTGGRGRDFKKCTQLQLGKYETEDQITAARHFQKLPWVDAGRIGIWGWSYGGYLSTSCILKGNDVFKMAMAVAPVTNWKWYDSAYTERYMRTAADNPKGYEENAPVNFADRLKGSYLVCHGTADDNVHWQQTTELINALIAANKQFETYYYPNRNHGIYGDNATMHLFTKLTGFVLEKL